MLFLHNNLQCDLFEKMMKSVYRRSVAIVLALMSIVLMPGCGDEVDVNAEYIAQEERYFNLYMGATFRDTIAPPTESGLYYIEITEGTGATPGEDDWVWVNYVGYKIPGDVVVDTYIENVAIDNDLYSEATMYGPFKLKNDSRNEGITEAFSMMKEGGEAIICFTSELGYGSDGITLMKDISAYQALKYELQLLEVIGDIEVYEQERIEAFVDTIPGIESIYDSTTTSTMYYVVDSIVEAGAPVVEDSLVAIAYKGYLVDGRVFDESAEDSYYEFPVGDYDDDASPIVGWHLGVMNFREGEKGRLIIPYELAYGEDGRVTDGQVSIAPYETLVFDIEIVSVRENDDDDTEEVK